MRVPNSDDIDKSSKAYGTRTIQGKIPWQQDQLGNMRESFKDGMKSMVAQIEQLNNLEHIICAANYYDDGTEHVHKPINIKTGFITCGHRHHNCINTFAQIVGFPYSKESQQLQNTEVQGFLTNTNRFIDRKEAGKIAFEAGQTKELEIDLHSEDLY